MSGVRRAVTQTQESPSGAHMKFAVDAHLPPGLFVLLQSAGHDALHTRQLPAQNRTADEVLNTLSLQEQRVVVTKDTDFYHSHLLHGKPWKLLLVHTQHPHARAQGAVRPASSGDHRRARTKLTRRTGPADGTGHRVTRSHGVRDAQHDLGQSCPRFTQPRGMFPAW